MVYALQAVGLVAVASWFLIVFSLIQIVNLAPKGKGISVVMDLGWWKHDKVAAAIGSAAQAPLKRYRFGFYVFFALVFSAFFSVFAMTM